MRWIVGMIGLWLALSATPAFADSMTVYDEDRWRGNTTWPTATVMDTAAGDVVELSEEPGRLTINAQTRPEYGYFSVQFEGPGVAGRLEKGVYPAAQRTYQRHKDRPGIGYSASSYYGFSYCKIFRGSFEVLDLVRDSSDRITGAWIVWEQHCEGEMGSFFGEVRVGLPNAPGPRTVPSHVRFPEAEPGGHSMTVPVEVRGDAPITDARIVGDDFQLVSHTCTGATTCEVQLRAAPGAAGTRTAKLRVTDATGARREVPLEVHARGGTTGLTLVSAPGEWVGQGRTWTYGPDTQVDAGGSRERLEGRVKAANDENWRFAFVLPDGDVLTPGTTYRVSGNTGAPTPYFSIGGNGRTCGEWRGSFTVHELAWVGNDLDRARITFEVDCILDPGAFLRGTFTWHAGDQTSPARWMIPSHPPVEPAPLPAVQASVTYTREGWVRPTWDAQAGDRITVDTSGGGLKVHAAPGNHGQPLSLIFYTPPTQTGVRPGVYPHPRWIRDLERGPGDAAMEVVLDGHNPEELSGRFEVREFEQVGGVVTRAWILFETSDGDRTHSGEVRIGAPAVAGPRSAPTTLRYGTVDLGEPGVAAPVSFWPVGGAEISDVRVIGDEAQVRIDDCTDAPVVAGEACRVWVRFTPRAAGVRRATLRATDAAGRTTDVPLEIFAHGGETGYRVTSTLRARESGSVPIMFPGTEVLDTTSDFVLKGDPAHLWVNLTNARNGYGWTLHFAPPRGETLQVGRRYTNATYYSSPSDQPGLAVITSRACPQLAGEFTVHELERAGGVVTRTKVSYRLTCEPYFTGSLEGVLSWRAGDATPLAPWMVASDGPVPTPTPTVSPTATPSATATATASPTPTATASPTPAATATASPTTTPGATATPSATVTPNPTATATASPTTPSATATATASADPMTPSDSATPTTTRDPGATATPTAAPEATVMPGPTPSAGPLPRVFSAPDPVRAAVRPCLTKARALARTTSAKRRAAAARFVRQTARCHKRIAGLPDSPTRQAALATLKRHTAAARTLRSQRASRTAVKRAQRVLRTG